MQYFNAMTMKEQLVKLIMNRIYTRRAFAEGLADEIIKLFESEVKHSVDSDSDSIIKSNILHEKKHN
jgi:hypothetical protein